MPYSERPNSLFNNYGTGVLKNVAGPKEQEVEGSGENCIRGNLWFSVLMANYLRDKIK
jgi:hypothetical protein